MLPFKPVTIDSVNDLQPFVGYAARSCDYTPGNLVMWSRFMNYRYAIHRETLFIQCKSQRDLATAAYLPPVGKLPLEESIALLAAHCKEAGEILHLTAVPEEMTAAILQQLPGYTATQLEGWSDYIYSAQSLATLQGKALNKKRNRYNKFIAEQPDYTYNRCTPDDIAEVTRFLVSNRDCQHNRADNMRCYEQWQCIATVKNLTKFGQPSGVLRVNGEIAAFTLGEVYGDTLYVHIEKANHNITGTSEAINRMFVNDILQEYPDIAYVNREEDLGDPGLRQVKRAYNPQLMLHRYEISINA